MSKKIIEIIIKREFVKEKDIIPLVMEFHQLQEWLKKNMPKVKSSIKITDDEV